MGRGGNDTIMKVVVVEEVIAIELSRRDNNEGWE